MPYSTSNNKVAISDIRSVGSKVSRAPRNQENPASSYSYNLICKIEAKPHARGATY